MKTPRLDRQINLLKTHKRLEELTIDGEETLKEYTEIKQLILSSVGSRRELLNSFLDWQDEDNGMENDKEWNKDYLDRYLKTI